MSQRKLCNHRSRQDLDRLLADRRLERDELEQQCARLEPLLHAGPPPAAPTPGPGGVDWRRMYEELLHAFEALRGGAGQPSADAPPRPAEEPPRYDDALLRVLDWGNLKGDFRIGGVQFERREEMGVAFVVEARADLRAVYYEARFYDGAGVEMWPGRNDVGYQTWGGLVEFAPDFVAVAPYRWEAGARSRGWFMLPNGPDAGSLSHVRAIRIHRARQGV